MTIHDLSNTKLLRAWYYWSFPALKISATLSWSSKARQESDINAFLHKTGMHLNFTNCNFIVLNWFVSELSVFYQILPTVVFSFFLFHQVHSQSLEFLHPFVCPISICTAEIILRKMVMKIKANRFITKWI